METADKSKRINISVFFLVYLLCVVLPISAYAQVYTPNGSVVNDTQIMSESLTAYMKAYYRSMMEAQYPNAVFISEATSTYNCHAYAWHMTEGGSAVWMGISTNPTSVYWTDGSYTEVSSNIGTKVSYASDNHSAVTTTTNNYFNVSSVKYN